MKKNKWLVFLAGLILFCIAICTIPSSTQAAIVTADVVITEVGVYTSSYYKVVFDYNTTTYTKYLRRPDDKDLFATALTALSLGGTASCKFDDSFLNAGWIYEIYAQ